jgi:hypothetical protein
MEPNMRPEPVVTYSVKDDDDDDDDDHMPIKSITGQINIRHIAPENL